MPHDDIQKALENYPHNRFVRIYIRKEINGQKRANSFRNQRERDLHSARLVRQAWPCKREPLSPFRSTLLNDGCSRSMDELEAGELFTDGFLLRLRERERERRREREGEMEEVGWETKTGSRPLDIGGKLIPRPETSNYLVILEHHYVMANAHSNIEFVSAC